MSASPIETVPGASAQVVGPDVARAYAVWLADRAREPVADAYYSEARARFEPEAGDVLVIAGDESVHASGCGVRIVSERASASLEVCGVRALDASRILSAVDGVRSARDVQSAAAVDEPTFRAFLAGTFGTLTFAPLAVAALEQQAPSGELVRFVGSPYEIVRPYWRNMAAVRERLDDPAEGVRSVLGDTARFVAFLRALHVLALVGADGRSFYRPASPVAGKEPALPGDLSLAGSVTEATPQGTRFVSGLRVNASPIGGDHYRSLRLAAFERRSRASDAAAAAHLSRVLPDGATTWGRVVVAKSDADDAAAPWFCPPRPMTAAHFDVLRDEFAGACRAADAGDTDAALALAGRFHFHFVRLHPFPFANQSVAMSLANVIVRRLLGRGIPHLVLDHLAFEASTPEAAWGFQRAVAAWHVSEEHPVRRTLELVARKKRCFDFLNALARVSSLEEARALAKGRPEDASLALV